MKFMKGTQFTTYHKVELVHLKKFTQEGGFFLGTEKPIDKPPNENIRALWERIHIYRSVYVTSHSSSPNYVFAKFFSHLHKKNQFLYFTSN
jgi:hypothetical protein